MSVVELREGGGDLAVNSSGTTEGDEADGNGALGADGEQMGRGDTAGLGSRDGAAAMTI